VCPAWAFRDAVYRDDLRALIREGDDVPEEVLERTRAALVAEYGRLSGNESVAAGNIALAQWFGYRYRILGLNVCRLAAGTEQAAAYLRGEGLSDAGTPAEVDRRVVRRLKELTVRERDAAKRYERLAARPGGRRMTAEEFDEQLVVLSKDAGFRITPEVTMRELAAYVKNFVHMQKVLENARNNKKR